jgi:Glyoxalase-like domain
MTLKIGTLSIDSKDPDALAEWWAEALDFEVTYRSPQEETEDREVAIEPKGGGGWELLFLQVPDEKVVKNRYHLDLRPDNRDAEVDRLIGMGAKKVDVGQGPDVTWVVLADPEGNEFCVLRARTPEELAAES